MEKQTHNGITLVILKYILICLAIFINFLFLSYYDNSYFFAISQLHGNIGYNLARHNACNLNYLALQHCNALHEQKPQLTDYCKIPNFDYSLKEITFPINDTIGYGILLGLLWKLTGSFSFFDIQVVQIAFYAFLMLLLYQIAFLIFNDNLVAFFCCIAQLLFFPLIWLNVQPVRDVWAYYGLIFLVYGVLKFLLHPHKQASLLIVVLCGFIFSICQFVRPSVFFALISLSVISFGYSWHTQQIKRILWLILVLWITNILIFWVPFCTYNIKTYNRLFVGPVGQDLLEGLGEFENPWNYHLCDEWLADYIGKKYNLIYGTPEFDDMAKKEFYAALSKNPFFYITTILKRIPQIIFPGLPWVFSHDQKSWGTILSKWYSRLFLLLGYIGFIFAIAQKRYFFFFLVAAILFAGLGKLPSHIEYRYLIPFYWVFSFGVGIIFHRIYTRIF